MKARTKLIILFTLITAALLVLAFVNLQHIRDAGPSPRSALSTVAGNSAIGKSPSAASTGQRGEIT
ncbi:hypothetical protein ACFVYC_21405 [Pseudarthrobacter sp. NPDC058329]|uniref:hypothetical protein n=1 Tax=Pseudarthrobacter sp. NPDC058329 TaxID=3346448 RepID=UPI0036DA0EAE